MSPWQPITALVGKPSFEEPVQETTQVWVGPSDRVLAAYPGRSESVAYPRGTFWIVVAVLVVLFFVFFGLIWLLL